MIRAGFGKNRKEMQAAAPVQAGEGGYLVSDSKNKARKTVPFLRLLGNFLILAGVILMVGIGGWWGYTTWDNQRFKDEGVKAGKFVVDPTPDASFLALATPGATETLPSPTPTEVLIQIASLNNGPAPKVGDNLIPTVTPVPIADTSPPVHLTIPSVHIDSSVVPVGWEMLPAGNGKISSQWDVAKFAVGHHAGSSNPGEPGNVVMSGHVDFKGQVFKDLHLVNKGDEVIVQTEKGQYVYVITDLYIVQEEGVSAEKKRQNAHFMDPTSQPTLTMITCYPYGVDDQRFIAVAHPYQPATTSQLEYAIR